MEFKRGRLFDHVHLRVADVEASKRFYQAVFGALGLRDEMVEADGAFYLDDLYIDKADGPVTHVHLAFMAKDRAMVDAFHQAVMAAGARDNGPPGERAYHPGYYAAFAFDPDGNNIEAVYHGPFERSAEAVVITPTA